MEEERERAVVVNLIEKAVESTAAEVDPRLLRAIKYTVRYSDSELRFSVQTLMILMKRDHSQVRYLALLIIDELFMRSKLFRNLIVDNLDQLLSLSIGFRKNHPLPEPASVASFLRSKAIEFLEKWNESFGIHYRQLRLGYEYLKNTLRFQFPNLQANVARIRQERMEREMRTKEILLKKFDSLKEKISSLKEEIRTKIGEIDECIGILRTEDGDVALDPFDDEEIEEFRNSELRQIRIDSLKEGEKVHENSANEVVFDALRESYKVLITKHLAAIQEWISVLIRVDVSDNTFRDSALKDLIDLRNDIQSTKSKCEESGCGLPKIEKNSEEDVIWEEGTVKTLENEKNGPSCSKIHEMSASDGTRDAENVSKILKNGDNEKKVTIKILEKEKNGPSCSKIHEMSAPDSTRDAENVNKISKNEYNKKNLDRKESKSDPERDKLLKEAPVLNWGSFLDNWGSRRDVFANQRGLDLESHWGRVDHDAVIPADKIAELNVHASVYREEPTELRPCRAPLRKGGLCQRKDLKVCPFHGPVVPRNDEGKPINEDFIIKEEIARNDSEESSREMDSDSVDRLLKQAVKNVRERDKEEVNKRGLEKRASKRAKLAKVREHNESVLRDAAIASTWRSARVGEGTEICSGSRSSGKNGSNNKNKQTLASMLKTKESTKDRLSQRLLSSRARGATIGQLTAAEEANYREVFSNQW